MTSIDVPALYREVEERLDMDYVRDTAKWVTGSLRGQGLPIGVAFQPGDGTRYDLVFVPLQNLGHAPGRIVKDERWGHLTSLGVDRVPGTAFVSWYHNGSGGFDFRSGGFEPTYLLEVFDTTMGSACTIALLFNSLAEAWNA